MPADIIGIKEAKVRIAKKGEEGMERDFRRWKERQFQFHPPSPPEIERGPEISRARCFATMLLARNPGDGELRFVAGEEGINWAVVKFDRTSSREDRRNVEGTRIPA